jgi:hypothetical protein
MMDIRSDGGTWQFVSIDQTVGWLKVRISTSPKVRFESTVRMSFNSHETAKADWRKRHPAAAVRMMA